MKYTIAILFLLMSGLCFSQTFINRSGAANTVIDQRLGAAQNFYLPRLMDTTLSGGKDTIGNLIYDRLRAKIAIRDTVLAGGHKFTFLFKEDDTISVLATKYDLTQLANGPTVYTGDGAFTGDRHISGGANGFAFRLDSTSSISLFSGLEYPSSGVGAFIQMSDTLINMGGSSATDFTSFVFSPTRIKFTAADGAGNSGDVWTNVGSGYGHWASASGGGATLNNIGTGFAWAATPGGNIKRVANSNTILWDSTSTANSLTAKVDTSVIATQFDISGFGPGTVTQVNTGYGLSGGPITITGTIVADTSSSNGLATKNFVTNTKTWPAEGPVGIIYSKNTWTNLADYIVNTSGGATTTLALSGGFVNYTVTSIDWDNYTRILYTRPTILPRWQIKQRFKMITAPGAGTVGFGMGTKGVIGGNDVLCYINTTNGGGSGTISINKGDGTAIWASGASSAVSQNDIIELIVTFTDSVITFSAQNITTASSVSSISYTNTLVSAASPISVLSNWSFIGHSSTPCTWQIQAVEITSPATRNANLYCIGDSKTQGAFADFFATRFPVLLNNTYPSSLVYASGNATIADFNNYMGEEITYLNGVQYLVSLGSNDKRNGATLAQMQDRYTKLIKILEGGGAKVRHIVIPEDSTGGGVGLTDFKNWVAATYPEGYIDVWTFMSTGNMLKSVYDHGDGVHPNQAGMNVIDSLIQASGKILVTPSNRRSPYRVTDNAIKTYGDSLFLDPIDKAIYHVNHTDRNGASRTGVLVDDGEAAGAVPSDGNLFTPMIGMIFTATGQIGINGATGGLGFASRNGSQTASAFALYAESGLFRIFDATNSIDNLKMDQSRRTLFINNTTNTTLTIPAATIHIGGNTLGIADHAPLKIDSGALTSTPEPYAIEATFDSLYWTNDAGIRVALNRVTSETISVATSSAGTLTLANTRCYIFNGTTTTWTLPAVSGTTGTLYYIKNIGSGSITLNADSGNNEIYSTSAVNTITITAGSAIILISNGTYFTVN